MADVPLPSTNTVWKSVKPFLNGGLSGMLATCVIQPIDMVKVRIQLGAQGSPVRPSSLVLLKQHLLLKFFIYWTARISRPPCSPLPLAFFACLLFRDNTTALLLLWYSWISCKAWRYLEADCHE